MLNIRTFLRGKKTYGVSIAMVLEALVPWISGAAPLVDTNIPTILMGLGLAALRAGMNKQ